jgi:hypothetical protein
MHAALADDAKRGLATGLRRQSGKKGRRCGKEQARGKSDRGAKGAGFPVPTGG